MLRSSLFFQIAQFEFFGFFADLGFWSGKLHEGR